MTKRYMDFAPVKKTAAGKAGASVASGAGVRSVGASRTGRVTRTGVGTQPRAVARTEVGMQSRAVTQPGVETRANGVQVGFPTAKRRVVRPQARVKATANGAKASGVATRATTRPATRRAVASQSAGLSMPKRTVKLGEIEDLNPKFVKTDVPKRPLGGGAATRGLQKSKASATEAKAKRIGGRLRRGRAAKADATKAAQGAAAGATKKAAYSVPNSPFINQGKVAKRPLSKNIYREQTSVPSKAIGNVAGKGEEKILTIVAKPEKDSKMGVIIAIVLTIILGAVAGTVAFLLLPK